MAQGYFALNSLHPQLLGAPFEQPSNHLGQESRGSQHGTGCEVPGEAAEKGSREWRVAKPPEVGKKRQVINVDVPGGNEFQ